MVFDIFARLDFGIESKESTYHHAAALAELERLLGAPSTVTVVEVSGDRWAGKTTLLQDFSSTAATAGRRVAVGSATSTPPGAPFGVFIDALNELIGLHGTDLTAVLPSEYSRWLGEIFPALATTIPAVRPVGPGEMYNAFHAIRALIVALCTFGDLVLQLDDMHWADEASVDLLAHLIRYPPEGNVMMVVAHRPHQGNRAFHGLLSAAVANGVAHRIALASLRESEAQALLPPDVSHPRCVALLRESGGNPGLLKALASLRIPGRCADAPPRLPSDVLAACLRDFRTLSTRGWLVARSAAVLDEPFEPNMLATVAQIDDSEVGKAIDELVSEDLICSDGIWSRLRFRNPLLRGAAYQSAGPGWLLGAHTRATEMLLGQARPFVQIARHVQYAAVSGDEHGGELLLAAAGENLWRDPAQAASWIRAAAELHAAMTPARDLLLGKALALAGRLAEALKVLDAVAAVAAGDPVWAEAVRWRAWVNRLAGRPGRAVDDLTALLTATPSTDADATARAAARQARLIIAVETGTRPVDADDIVLRQELATVSGLPAGHAAAVLAAAHHRECEESARQHATAAAAVFDRATDDQVVQHLDGMYWLARAEDALGLAEAAYGHCERGLRLAEQRRLVSMVPQFAAAFGTLQLRGGDTAGAARHAACARRTASLTGGDHLMALSAALERAIRHEPRPGEAAGPRRPMPAEVLAIDPLVIDSPAGEPAASEPVRPDEHDAVQTKLELLSRRELEIAFLVSHGRTNQQIARKLGLSHKTVETYLARIFKKLVVSCRAEVAAIVGRSNQFLTC